MIRFLGLLSVTVFTALLGSLFVGSPANAQSPYDDAILLTDSIGVTTDEGFYDISNSWLTVFDLYKDQTQGGVYIGDLYDEFLDELYSENPQYGLFASYGTPEAISTGYANATTLFWIRPGCTYTGDTFTETSYSILTSSSNCVQRIAFAKDPNNPDDIRLEQYTFGSGLNISLNTPTNQNKIFFSTLEPNYPPGYEGELIPEVAPGPGKEAKTEWALHGDNDGTLKVNYLDNLPFIARGLTEYELWEANDDWELTTQVLQDDVQPTQGVELTFFESLDSNKNYIWLASYQPIEDGWIPAVSAIGFNYTGRPFFMTNQGCTNTVKEGSLIGTTYYCNPLDPDTPEANQASGIGQIMTGQNFLSDEVNLLIDIATLPIGIIGKASNYKTECVPKNASVMGGQITLPCIENHVRGLGASTVNNMINFVIDMYQTVLLVSVILGTTSISIAVMLNLINPLGSMKMWWPW